MSPSISESSHKGKSRPQYFLVRLDGDTIPLIAVDELPTGIDIVGVPRSLHVEEKGGMLQLVSGPETKKGHGNLSSKTKLYNLPPSPLSVDSALTVPTNTLQLVARNRHPAQLMLPSTFRCRHWCHHGSCKYGQECHHRHDMPMDLQGLQEVGLTDWPSWYKALNPGYFVSELQHAGHKSKTRTSAAGHGTSCCGAGGKSGRKLRNRGLGERAGQADDALGQQIISRLQGMARESSGAGEKGNILIEKVAATTTRDWDEDSEES